MRTPSSRGAQSAPRASDAIDQRGVDRVQAGDEEFVEQAVRLQFAGDGFGFAAGRGRAAPAGRRAQFACGLGVEVQLLLAQRRVGGGERRVGEDAAQQQVSFVRDGVGRG